MVERKKLGDICEVLDSQRRPVSKGNRNKGYYPYYGANGIQDYVDSYIFDGTYLLMGEDGSVINKDNSPVLHWATGKIWVNNHAHILQENRNASLRYLFYSLQCIDVSDIVRGVPPKINQANMRNILIPVPSLSEQKRIVGILDTFTASIDNLKEQIAQRRKQYEYYRDQLLDLEGKPGVEMKSLGEVGEFIRGAGILKSDFVDEGFPCIHYGQIHTKYGISATKAFSQIDETLYKKCKKAVKGDVVLATTSEDAEGCAKPVAWLGEEEVAVSGDAYIYHHNQNGKFMAYQFMTHNFMLFKIMNATGAKVVRISGDNMAKYEFPLPSLEEQQRIVSILDTFEASIQNLEAQLKQREKQYEYYRNKLLTFE
jgi:type I restriction enzyme S subunit